MTFNQFFNFLFINSKISTFLFIDSITLYRFREELYDEGTEAQIIYKKQIRRYLGLGFFLSFIPGTEPFLARKNLLSVITAMESEVDPTFEPVQSVFLTTPLYIFYRLFASCVELFRVNPLDFFKGATKLNRLNPLFYLASLILILGGLFTFGIIILIEVLFPNFEFDLSPYISIPLAVVFGLPLLLIGFVYMIAYFLTELALNTLYAVLVDPFIFVYESVHQLLTAEEFIYSPTEDYQQINSLLNAMEEEPLSNAHSTKELTLIEAPKEEISRFEKHHESFFYTLYKDTALFKPKSNERILRSHKLVENLFKFSFFCKIEEKLYKDVRDLITKTGIESDRADIECKKITAP